MLRTKSITCDWYAAIYGNDIWRLFLPAISAKRALPNPDLQVEEDERREKVLSEMGLRIGTPSDVLAWTRENLSSQKELEVHRENIAPLLSIRNERKQNTVVKQLNVLLDEAISLLVEAEFFYHGVDLAVL